MEKVSKLGKIMKRQCFTTVLTSYLTPEQKIIHCLVIIDAVCTR
jgi:hypothetical protein